MQKVRPIIAALLLSSASPLFAEQAGWELIGERTVDRGRVHAEIPTRPIVYASHLRLCADRQSVRFDTLHVRYRNGHQQSVPVQLVVPAGRCTTDIALRNQGERDIDRVSFALDAEGSDSERPRIFVFARAGLVLR
jgi:hypothetical protein